MTGIEPEADFSLEDCGLASIGMAQLVGLINKRFSRSAVHVQVSVMDMIEVQGLRHHFGPSLRDIWALYHPTHAVYCAILGYHACGMLIGAYDPMS